MIFFFTQTRLSFAIFLRLNIDHNWLVFGLLILRILFFFFEFLKVDISWPDRNDGKWKVFMLFFIMIILRLRTILNH